MTCNAWNHASNCACGWGGTWHGQAFQKIDSYELLRHFRDPVSFVNPNALCPICQSPVYYYESPYGGRVYFDELGPPWPKHPCTDRIFKLQPQEVIFRFSTPTREPKWIKDGWEPFILSGFGRQDADLMIFMGQFKDREEKIYVKVPIRHGLKSELDFSFRASEHIAQLRMISDSLVEISFYSFRHKNRLVQGSLHAYEARTLPALV